MDQSQGTGAMFSWLYEKLSCVTSFGRVLGGYHFFSHATNLFCQWDLTLKHGWIQGPNNTHSHSSPHNWNSWKLCHSDDLIKWLMKNILFKELVVVLEKKHHTKVYPSSSCMHQCNLKAHFRYWGSGSKFLGTSLNSFEAYWTLELNLAVGPIYGSHPIGLLYFNWTLDLSLPPMQKNTHAHSWCLA